MLLLKSYLLRCFISAFVAAALLPACSLRQHVPLIENGAHSKNASQTPRESWYNLTLMNTKIGYQHTSSENVEYEGEAVRRTKTDTVMNFKALGSDLTVKVTRVTYTGSDLMPRYFLSTSNESGLKQVEGRVVDGIAHIKTTLDRETIDTEIPIPPDTISERKGIDLFLAQEGLKVGDKQTFYQFSFDFLKPVKTELHLVGKESLTYHSEEKQVYVLSTTMDVMGGMNMKSWLDSNGVNYRTEVPLMGLSLVTTKTDKETAVGGIEEIDVILQTRILPVGKRPTRNAKHLVAEVKLTTGRITETIMSNSRQKLVVNTEQAGKLSIQVPPFDAEACPDLPIQNVESEFLAASIYIQANHPDVRAKAVEVIDGETNSWRAAEKLCRWIDKAISDKMTVGYNSSLATLESLAGDCTEHTVLFIALARSVGIPSRICSGIVFAKDAFYYHLWPEVYVGRWVQMDPTLGQLIADANHIQLGGSILESNTVIEFGKGVLQTLNQLEITIIE
jgi:hypothetical protein